MQTLRRWLEEPCGERFDPEAALWEDVSARALESLRTILELSMETELTQRLGYRPYAREAQVHTDYRNGYYTRDLETRFGRLRACGCPAPASRSRSIGCWSATGAGALGQ